MKEWILKHRFWMTFALIAGAFIFIGLITVLSCYLSNESVEVIEALYYSSQIVASIFVISGVIIGVWQYYLSYVDSRRNLDIIRVQKAIELAEYYKDNILCSLAPLRYIYEESGIKAITSKVIPENMIDFDKRELLGYISQEEMQKLKKLQESDQFFMAIVRANSIYNLGLNDGLINLCEDKNITHPLSPTDAKAFSVFLNRLISQTLNNMEFFSLHFTHKSADDSVIFESLHQTYIKLVQLLYYNISMQNDVSPCKYYSNVTELYKKWIACSENSSKEFFDGVRQLRRKGTVIDEG